MSNLEKQPIFKPMRSEFRILNLSAPAAAVVAAVLLVGAAAATLLGGVTREVQVPYNEYQRNAMVQEYQALSVRLASMEAAAEAGQTLPQDADLYEQAAAAGVRPGMGKYEIEALVPTYYVDTVEAIPMAARVLFLVVVPTTAAYVLLFESSRTTMLKELRRMRRLKKSQKAYKYDPGTYMVRADGGDIRW